MKLIITKENLIKAMQKIIGVVEKRQAMPILSHILLEKKEDNFEVLASDLEVQLSSNIIFESESEYTKEFTAPGRKLFDICKGLPDEAVLEIEDREEGKLQIKSKRSKFILSALDAKTFPLMETENENNFKASIKSNILSDIIEKTSFAMAQQDVRYYLNGLFLNFSTQEVFV